VPDPEPEPHTNQPPHSSPQPRQLTLPISPLKSQRRRKREIADSEDEDGEDGREGVCAAWGGEQLDSIPQAVGFEREGLGRFGGDGGEYEEE